jgi:hypothetical protein
MGISRSGMPSVRLASGPAQLGILWVCVALALGMSARPLQAAEQRAATTRFVLSDRGSLELPVPAGWSSIVRRKQPDFAATTIVFGPLKGVPFEVSLALAWDAMPADAAAHEKSLQQKLDALLQAVKGHTVESEIRTVKLKGANLVGSYFSATDNAPRVGEYKHMVQGVAQLDALTITFTILTHDGQDAVVDATLTMLKGAKLRGKS